MTSQTMSSTPFHSNKNFSPFTTPNAKNDAEHQLNFFDVLVPNPWLMYSPPEIELPPLPDHLFSSGVSSCESVKKELPPTTTATTTLSAQSISARQRRRKITEKTHEFGKLVPGGLKMNTAEMLQSAYKYIKFLQAQVGVLEFISASCHNQEKKDSLFQSGEDELMRILLESPLIQEKLYSSEKCLIPKKFVHELRSDHDPKKYSSSITLSCF